MRAENTDTVNCPSCSATLVAGLRFCRMCGYRLGEGVEEYVQTQRFDPASPPITAAPPPSATDPFNARTTWGGAAPMQPFQPLGTTTLKQPDSSTAPFSWAKVCKQPTRGRWWLWTIMALVLMFSAGILPLTIKLGNRGGSGGDSSNVTTSLLKEADGYDTADGGGAMIRGLAGPDTSLEAAGLVGGDIITNFDGNRVRDGDTMKKLIAATKPGQTIPIDFIRDEQPKKTVLTATGIEGFHGMDLLRQRPGGRGVLDIDFDDGDRVRVPDLNIYGVELDGVERNGPADIAGLKKGDIIVEFDGKPIRTAGDLRYRAGAATPLSIVNIVVVRDGQQVTIPVKMGRQR
ncbi:MAG: hypothetical protein QOC99_713 [Acidobacteriota bacterium]|nr:hypothetical protein [Acidobacteriota bacterium]